MWLIICLVNVAPSCESNDIRISLHHDIFFNVDTVRPWMCHVGRTHNTRDPFMKKYIIIYRHEHIDICNKVCNVM